MVTPNDIKKTSEYNPEALIAAIGKTLQGSNGTAGPCPDFELISAFANKDKLDSELADSIRNHLSQCSRCTEDVIDMRLANDIAEKAKSKESLDPSEDTQISVYMKEKMDTVQRVRESLVPVYLEIWDHCFASIMEKYPERVAVPGNDKKTFNFDVHEFPAYTVAYEPFRDVQPMFHSTDVTASQTFKGFVCWRKHDREIGRAIVDAIILAEDFTNGTLTISGSLLGAFSDLVPRIAAWYCKWETTESQEDMYPGNFYHDIESGQFAAVFTMDKRVEGRFVIWFDVQLETK